MLVKLQTPEYLIYAELDKTERVTHLASKNRIPIQTCYAILHEIEQRGDFHITWGWRMTGIPILFGSRWQINGYLLSLLEKQITASVETDNLTATTTRQSPQSSFVSTRIIEQCIQAISV